jgi:hypothetical protein
MKFKYLFVVLIMFSFLTGCAKSPFGWYEVNVTTPTIYNQKDAENTCPLVCEKKNAKWSGKWFNKKSSGCICKRQQCAPNCVLQWEPGTISSS